MIKVSIIIPVYNSADTIVRCLDSVLAQTLDDIEAVIVDDHGSDGSTSIAREHLSDYKGGKHFCFASTPVNGGPGAARNVGLAEASGEYVAFLDSDDTLEPDYCEALYAAAKASDADMAFCHISYKYPDGAVVVKRNPAVRPGRFTGLAKKRYLRRYKTYFATYIYNRKMLIESGIRFPDTRSAEDSCMLCCSLMKAERIAFIDRVLYHYNVRPESVSHQRDRGRAAQRLASFRALKDFARSRGLWLPYRGVLRWIIFKKGWLLAAKDLITG